MADPPAPSGPPAAPLWALILGQLGLHAVMAGIRMAGALQALREGQSAWAVGLLLALFAAAPVLTALPAGRAADRHGYHRPVGFAVAVTLLGGVLAVASTIADGPAHFVLLCGAALATGAGANVGMLAIQRTAGVGARDSSERVRVFSWLGIAPSFSNVLGPVLAGFMIDWGGFRAAYLALLVLPLATLVSARWVVRAPPAPPAAPVPGRRAWHLLREPMFRRLLIVNWLLSSCWDVHTFAIPVLGHERGYSASTVGLILGSFTASVTLVRLVLPVLVRRVQEGRTLCWSMAATAVVMALYPLAPSAWAMGVCAVLLGISLGVVQPMVMSLLHHLTPDQRHGEALALRSMAINASSTLMPVLFGLSGAALGPAVLFWAVGGAAGLGSWLARALPREVAAATRQ